MTTTTLIPDNPVAHCVTGGHRANPVREDFLFASVAVGPGWSHIDLAGVPLDAPDCIPMGGVARIHHPENRFTIERSWVLRGGWSAFA